LRERPRRAGSDHLRVALFVALCALEGNGLCRAARGAIRGALGVATKVAVEVPRVRRDVISTTIDFDNDRRGELPKRSNGSDCKSDGLCLRRFESCTPHSDSKTSQGISVLGLRTANLRTAKNWERRKLRTATSEGRIGIRDPKSAIGNRVCGYSAFAGVAQW
jgi:hypothetical protein